MKGFHIAVTAALVAIVAAAAFFAGKTSGKQGGISAWALTHKKASEADDVIAEIGSIKIYASEFIDRINNSDPILKTRYNQLENKIEYIKNNMVRNEALTMAAVEEGLDLDADVIASAKQMMIQKLMKKKFDQLTKPEDVKDSEITDYYSTHRSDFYKPEQRRASHILFKTDPNDPASEKDAKANADKVYKELVSANADVAKFAEYAKKYSQDSANANNGGDLSYFPRAEEGGKMHKEFSEAVFAAKTLGEILPPVITALGWHVIKLTGIIEKKEQAIEEVRNSIRNILFKQKRSDSVENYIKNLMEKYNVKINNEAIAKITFEVPKSPIKQ